MRYTLEALIQVLIIIAVAIALIWAINAFLPELCVGAGNCIPTAIVTILNVIIVLGAVAAIVRTLEFWPTQR